MQTYRVILQRSVVTEAAINVRARSSDEAEQLARERSRDGLVAWVEVFDETEAEAEGQ